MRGAALIAAAGLIALTVGCSSEPDPLSPQPDEPSAADIEPDRPQPEPEDPVVDQDQPGEDELAATWRAFHAAWVEQAALDQPDPDAFDELTADPDATVEALDALRAGGRLVTTDAELWPTFTIDGQRAEIVDCAIVNQHPDGQPDSVATVTISWEATATATDDGWRIDTAQPGELFCIAEGLNDQLLEAYRQYREALDAAWDPPDPDHPDLERTMAGEQLEFIRELLVEHQRDGIVVKEPAPTDNAVVFDVSIGGATVSDCTEQVPGYGAFDLETGDRLDEVEAPVEPGRLDAQSVELTRTDTGAWRVIDQAASRDTDCEIGSTRYAVS